MRRLDLLAAGQIRDGACQLEHAVIGPRAQMQLLHTCTCAATPAPQAARCGGARCSRLDFELTGKLLTVAYVHRV